MRGTRGHLGFSQRERSRPRRRPWGEPAAVGLNVKPSCARWTKSCWCLADTGDGPGGCSSWAPHTPLHAGQKGTASPGRHGGNPVSGMGVPGNDK